jgi:hypothetical protein
MKAPRVPFGTQDRPARILLFLLLFAITFTVVSYGYVGLGRPVTGVDDADIFLVYAANLREGHGFVYNPGGEKVEGFSSLLWVLILAALGLLAGTIERAALFLNCLLVSLVLLIIVLRLRREQGAARASPGTWSSPLSLDEALLLAWTFGSPAFVSWATISLMETGLWCFLLTVATAALIRSDNASRNRHLAVALPLLALGRPDGFLWGTIMLAVLAWSHLREGKGLRGAASAIAFPALCFLATVSLVTLWRQLYFGYPLPNTYYAKVSPDAWVNLRSGLDYFVKFLRSEPLAGLSIATALCGVAAQRGRSRWKTSARERDTGEALHAWGTVSLVVLLGSLLPIAMGGDHLPMFRFYQPLWPLYFLPPWYMASLFLVPTLARRGWERLRPVKALGILLVVVPFLATTISWRGVGGNPLTYDIAVASCGRSLGETLNDWFRGQELPSVGIIAAGGIKVTYQGTVIDLVGLNSSQMAHFPGRRDGIKNHAAFSKEVFFLQAPDLLMPNLSRDLDAGSVVDVVGPAPEDSLLNRTLQGLLFDPRFLSTYTFAVLERHGRDGREFLAGYYSGDFIRRLRAAGMPLHLL